MSSTAGTQSSLMVEHNSSSDSDVRQYMSFLINGRTYAILLTQVAEITPMCELNTMPHTPKYVEGLLDLRGHVLPVVSLRTRMGLPKNESNEVASILILSHEGSRIGVLVDQVESVITATEEQHVSMSPLLEGVNGVWVIDILLIDDRVILVLDTAALATMAYEDEHRPHHVVVHLDLEDIELQLDASLDKLIKMAEHRHGVHIHPLMNEVILQTETEMTRVLDVMESMLLPADNIFVNVSQFKQEISMSKDIRLIDEANQLNQLAQKIQHTIFDVIDTLQFQDIVRQKLERIIHHIVIMTESIASGFH
jgi:purine-binding chemotaxis protein CheW